MKQETYYDLLEVSPDADLAEISLAHLRIAEFLSSGKSTLGAAQAALRGKLVERAYEVLSNPTRRADYDAGLIQKKKMPEANERPLYIEVGLEPNKTSPIRRLLTVIASVMVFGLIIQAFVIFASYQHAKAIMGDNGPSPAAEKVYLQDFYQTYGIRAASREEAELLLADMRKKEQQTRDEAQNQRLKENEERKQKQFEEESRRIGAEVSDNIQQAEQDAARQKEAELRQKEERERAEKAEERARLDREINRFRSRSRYSE
jgi:curved DNA-binding protein CbpA